MRRKKKVNYIETPEDATHAYEVVYMRGTEVFTDFIVGNEPPPAESVESLVFWKDGEKVAAFCNWICWKKSPILKEVR